jgi:hypothetical protein
MGEIVLMKVHLNVPCENRTRAVIKSTCGKFHWAKEAEVFPARKSLDYHHHLLEYHAKRCTAPAPSQVGVLTSR